MSILPLCSVAVALSQRSSACVLYQRPSAAMRNICCMLCDVRLCLCSVAAAPSHICLACAPYHCSKSAYVYAAPSAATRLCSVAAAPSHICLACAPYHCSKSEYVYAAPSAATRRSWTSNCSGKDMDATLGGNKKS